MAFTSVILKYKRVLIDEINKLISEGKDSEFIRKHLTSNHLDTLKGAIPDIHVIERYVKWRTAIVPTLANLNKADIATEASAPRSSIVDITALKTKKDMLDGLIQMSYERIKLIDKETIKQINPRLEGHLRAYVEEIRKTIEVLAKMSGELEAESTVTVNIVNEKLMAFTSIVQSTVMEVCPEKVNEFLKAFKSNFTKYMKESSKDRQEPIDITPVKNSDSKEDVNYTI